MSIGRLVVGLLGPDIPAHLRDDFTLLTTQHMRGQARLLFAGFILSLPMVTYGASPGAGPAIAYGIPLIVLLLSSAGLVTLSKPARDARDPLEARRTIGSIWRLCLATAAIGGVWCIASWATAPPVTRIYYPAIMSLGALTLGYCLTAVRGIGISVLLVSLAPTAAVLAWSGGAMDIVLAVSMIIAIGFQVTMMVRHQQLLLGLVEARYDSARQARLDPLTGLANRRGLMDRLERLAARRCKVRLMVIDIDRFKAINDGYGHDVGDEVLRAFAELMRIHARGEICAARLGGEEFALLAPVEALDPAIALQLLIEIRSAYMPHGEQITASIGVAEGEIASAAGWTALYGRADRALYRAKNEGRNRVIACEASDTAKMECEELRVRRA